MKNFREKAASKKSLMAKIIHKTHMAEVTEHERPTANKNDKKINHKSDRETKNLISKSGSGAL